MEVNKRCSGLIETVNSFISDYLVICDSAQLDRGGLE